MAFGTTNISLNTVATTIGFAGMQDLFSVGTSELINKWSRYKPIRDTGSGTNWPSGTDGMYGLNFPTDWSYLQPRGGTPGGDPDEPVRLGDFRGYEHNQDNAGPVIYTVLAGIDIDDVDVDPTAPSPTYGFNFYKNETPHNDVKILPSDLGIDDWYWCVKITDGGTSYYKTTQSDLSTVSVLSVDYSLGTITMGSELPTFDDAPSLTGSLTYELGISSAATANNWNATTPPTGYITLPTGTYGSNTCINSGSFSVNQWIWVDDDSHSWTYNNTTEKDSGIRTSLLQWEIVSKPAWIDIQVYENDAGGHGTEVNDTNDYADDQWIGISPSSVNSGVTRSGDIELGTGATVLETISVTQDGAPPVALTPVVCGGSSFTVSDATALYNSTPEVDVEFDYDNTNDRVTDGVVQCEYTDTNDNSRSDTIGGFGGTLDWQPNNTYNHTVPLSYTPKDGSNITVTLCSGLPE